MGYDAAGMSQQMSWALKTKKRLDNVLLLRLFQLILQTHMNLIH